MTFHVHEIKDSERSRFKYLASYQGEDPLRILEEAKSKYPGKELLVSLKKKHISKFDKTREFNLQGMKQI